MRKNGHKLVVFIFLVCTISACYEPNQGCLDLFASNYEANTDEECDDNCCEFPDLILQFSHRWDSTLFSVNDILLDDFSNPFVFRKFDFLVSKVELIDAFGISHFITDSVFITTDNNSAYFKNDFSNVMTGISSYTIGDVKIKDPIIRIKFTIGIDLENVDISTLDSDFILRQLDTTHVNNGKYIPWKFEMERDTSSTTMEIEIINGAVTSNQIIERDKVLNNMRGSDIRVPINIEYRKLLEGINMSTSSDVEISTLISSNFSKTFD